jgi:hypothetical protein
MTVPRRVPRFLKTGPTKLFCRPVDHRFEETPCESFEADLLVGIVRRNLHQGWFCSAAYRCDIDYFATLVNVTPP